MNGYSLTHKMRRCREWFSLTATEQLLFFELVSVCNEKKWPGVFQCSNKELCTALGICQASLIKARNKLVESQLLYFQSGQKSYSPGSYSLTTPFDDTSHSIKSSPGEHGKSSPREHDKSLPDEHDKSLPDVDFSIYKHNTKNIDQFRVEKDIKKNMHLVRFDNIKNELLGDETWKELVAMQSGLSIKFLQIIPMQIDLFLQYIVAVGDEHTVLTISDAKKRFFWWWKNQGKKNYEEQEANSDTEVWYD